MDRIFLLGSEREVQALAGLTGPLASRAEVILLTNNPRAAPAKIPRSVTSPSYAPFTSRPKCQKALRFYRTSNGWDGTSRTRSMEMNARIQVGHAVNELITRIDLIQEQIWVAAGEPLSVSQGSIVLRSHTTECRIDAEDPENNFAPTPGRLDIFVPPAVPGPTWIRAAVPAG